MASAEPFKWDHAFLSCKMTSTKATRGQAAVIIAARNRAVVSEENHSTLVYSSPDSSAIHSTVALQGGVTQWNTWENSHSYTHRDNSHSYTHWENSHS